MKIGLLKQKNFSLLMFGKFISLVGTQMQDFALSLYVYKKTGSATLFASVIIAALIPQLILSPIAGVFADWLDRKKIIVYLDLASGAVVALFALQYWLTGQLTLPSIYVFVIVLTLISTLYQAANGTIIPTIIEKEDLVDANGINSLIMNVGGLISPLIAATLFGSFGLFMILVANAISFIIGSIAEIFIKIPKTNKLPEKISFKAFATDFSEGIRFIKDKKMILTIIVLSPILNFVLNPLFSVGIICITKKILKVSDFQYSIVQVTFFVSIILAPFIFGNYIKKNSLGKILFIDITIISALVAVMAIIPTKMFISLFGSNLVPYLSLILIIFVIGLVVTTANIALSVLFQKIVPLSMMGRVGTVMSTCCMSCMPLGSLIFGLLFDSLSAWLCVLICSVTLLITIMSFRRSLLGNEEVSYEAASAPELEIT